MALHVLFLLSPCLFLASDLSEDIESALVADVLAERCLSEDCVDPALSLLQTSAGLRREKRYASSAALDTDNEALSNVHPQKSQKSQNVALASNVTGGNEAMIGMSFLQMNSSTEHVESATRTQQARRARSEGTSHADSAEKVSYNVGIEVTPTAADAAHSATSQMHGPRPEDRQAKSAGAYDADFAEKVSYNVGIEAAHSDDSQMGLPRLEEPDVGGDTPPEVLRTVEPEVDDEDADLAGAPRTDVIATISTRHQHEAGAEVLPSTAPPQGESPLILVALCAALLGFALVFLWAMCMRKKKSSSSTDVDRRERAQVEAMPRCTSTEIEKMLASGDGYDCVSRPLSSGHPVRLEARIEGSADGSAICSPFKQKLCVRFSAAIYCQEKDGMPAYPIAMNSASVRFVVSLADAPSIRIEVHGDSVELFDMHDGHYSRKKSLASAPEHYRDFAQAWRCGARGGGHHSNQPRQKDEVFEFRETALIVGSSVTLLGELHRDSIGRLQLQPWRPTEPAPSTPACEPWRTSWEQSGCDAESSGKVLASDDPTLLGKGYGRWFQSSMRAVCGLDQDCKQSAGTSREPSDVVFAVPPTLKPGIASVKQSTGAKQAPRST